MMNSKLIEPGKWYIEYNDKGERVKHHYEDSTLKLLGYASRQEYIAAGVSWENAIHPDDLPGLLRYVEDLEAKHPEGMDYDAEYRIKTRQGYHWIHDCGHMERRKDGSPAYLNGTAFDIQDIKDKQVIAQRLEESLTFTNFFLNTYISAYLVNLDTCACQVYMRSDELKQKYPVIENYLDGITEYVNRDVHPDDRAELLGFVSPENLKKGLTDAGEMVHIFRDISGGDEKYYRLQIIRGADARHAAFGFIDITKEYRKHRSRFLGAIPLSGDILTKANIGLWSFELDEGCPPRMYADEAMLRLLGLEHQLSPEETYHAWYDNIDADSYDLVADAVAKMVSGEHAEVQYPWHHPGGGIWYVRCGGVRNPKYTKGIRIEGTHQNVTELIHFDEKERERAKKLESDLAIEKFRTEALSYIADHEPDMDETLGLFGKRILKLIKCDQLSYQDAGGKRLVLNATGISDLSQDICSACPLSDFRADAYRDNDIICINDCNDGCRGSLIHPACPLKSMYMQKIYSGGEFAGVVSVHYINTPHTFSERELDILNTVSILLGLLIGRVKEKQDEIGRIEAESSNRAKTEFLFNMSHDIRTPMNAILGFTDIAMNHIDEPDKVSDSLQKIKLSGDHLLSLINAILEMSRIEAGKIEIVSEPVNIYEATKGVTTMSRSLAESKSINLNIRVDELKNPYIYSDELHTNQVLINLISNAIKYTEPGGTVDYSIEQVSAPVKGIARYRATVKDNGIGMSEEFQKHLFESFSREKSTTVSRQEGAGLGLAIVKKIVDLMGGTITVTSSLGKGSVFVVELPLKVMDEDAIEAYEAERKRNARAAEEFSFDGQKVLLVEDNEMNREIATEILEEAGLVIETAEDGAIAVRRVIEKGVSCYDFILMDIQMPVMNGYEATAEIRKIPGADKIPIIALSANAFKEDEERSLAAGMNAHVAKPIDVKELFETMQGLIK